MSIDFPNFATVGFIDNLAKEISNCAMSDDSKILLDCPNSQNPPILLCIQEQILPPKDEKVNVFLDIVDASKPIKYKLHAVCAKENSDFFGRFIRFTTYQVYKSRQRILIVGYEYIMIEGDYSNLANEIKNLDVPVHPSFYLNPIAPPAPPQLQQSENISSNTSQFTSNQYQNKQYADNGMAGQQQWTDNKNINSNTSNNINSQQFNNNYNNNNNNNNNYNNNNNNYNNNNNNKNEYNNTSFNPQRQPPQNKFRNNGPYSNYEETMASNDRHITEISKLSPYLPKWKVLGRVIDKSPVRTFNSNNNEGQVFSIDIRDKSGEIRGIFFTKAVEKFKDLLLTNKTYYFIGGQIKPKRSTIFNQTNHLYEIYFDETSQIELSNDAIDVPKIKFEFIDIKQIFDKDVNSKVDVLAVVTDFKDITQINKKDGQKTEKRDITLLDKGQINIILTLWGDKTNLLSEQILSTHPVIAIKGAKVSDFMGKKLDSLVSTHVEVQPDDVNARDLAIWFNNNGKHITVDSFSPSAHTSISKCKSLNEIINEAANSNPSILAEKGVYFNCRAAIQQINEEKFSYPACPECKRKLFEDTNEGKWICQKCDKILTQPLYNYNLILNLVDSSGSLRCSCWNEVAEILFGGIKANELVELHGGALSQTGQSFFDIFSDAFFSEWVFTIRAKSDTYMDETKTKYRIIRLTSIQKQIDLDISEYINLISF